MSAKDSSPKTSDATNATFERALQICAGVAASVFFATGLAYLILGRWPITHQDFWRIYNTCLHRSWLASALLKYNGHSHFFPSQLWLTDLRFFHGDQDFLFGAGLFIQCAGTILLLLPIWRDQTVRLSAKFLSAMVLVVLTFWMGRASMTASGGFNCCYSLTLTGAALAFYAVSTARNRTGSDAALLIGAIAGGILASFSFGTGLATWAALLMMGFALRLRIKLLLTLGVAGVLAALVFYLLPSRETSQPISSGGHWFQFSGLLNFATYYFHMIGSPVMQMGANWSRAGTLPPGPSAILATTLGAAGAVAAGLAILFKLAKGNLRFGLESIGLALMSFNLAAFFLITVARADHIRTIPSELDAPRYYYWSTLFWAGLIIFGLGVTEASGRFRKTTACVALLLPFLAFPSHYRNGVRWRYVRLLSTEAATSLIDGVKDPEQIKILSPFPSEVFRLSDEMRARNLDMFALGFQKWIGLPEHDVFSSDRPRARFKARGRVRLLTTHPPSLRVHGSAIHKGGGAPDVLLILDSREVIQGIARSSSTLRWIDRTLYGGIFPASKFVGFVRTYNPRESYLLRSLEGAKLSEESISVPPPARVIGLQP